MLKRKLSTILLCAVLLGNSFVSISTVSASSIITSTVSIQKVTLSKADESNLKKSINEALSLKYEVLKTGKSKDYSHITKDSKLLKLLNKKSNFDVEWFKKFNGKTKEYTSNVTINNINKTSADTYVINAVYSVEFKLEGADFVSKSVGENYRVEVKNEDGKWYITKIFDLDQYKELIESQKQLSLQNRASTPQGGTNELQSETDELMNGTNFPDYDNQINSEIENLETKSKNIDVDYKQFKASDSTDANSQNKVNNSISALKGLTASITMNTDAIAYSGYNATNAIAYAHKYATSPNPQYKNFDSNGGDCTNFTSQCVLAGGIPASSSWYAYSDPWIKVIDFFAYMTNNGYASYVQGVREAGTQGARAGDVVQFANSLTWSHGVILTGTVNGGTWVFCGHTRPRLDYPLYAAYDDGGYHQMRTIKFWH